MRASVQLGYVNAEHEGGRSANCYCLSVCLTNKRKNERNVTPNLPGILSKCDKSKGCLQTAVSDGRFIGVHLVSLLS